MAGRSPSDAYKNYVDPLHKTLSCITAARLQTDFDRNVGVNFFLAAAGGESFVVKAGAGQEFRVTVMQRYRIVEADAPLGPFKVSVSEYTYALANHDEREILAYHHHPGSGPSGPHVHLSSGCGDLIEPLHRAHLPTGRIALEEFVRLLIRDFKVQSLRKDHTSVLERNLRAFRTYRTWH